MKKFVKFQLFVMLLLTTCMFNVIAQESTEGWYKIDVKPVIDIIAFKDDMSLAISPIAQGGPFADESIPDTDTGVAFTGDFSVSNLPKGDVNSDNGVVYVVESHMAITCSFTPHTSTEDESDATWHAPESFELSDISALEEPANLNSFKAYPNPARSIVNIELGEYADYELSLYNLVGALEVHKVINDERETSLDLSSLPEGLYLLQVVKGENVKTHMLKVAR